MKRQWIVDALLYIDAHFSEPLVLDDIAERAGYSVPQFSRLFSELCGITPMRYVTIVRVQHAAQMLLSAAVSVTDAAFACGFESLEVFERQFKRYYSVSPSAYRHGNHLSPSPFYLSEKVCYERLRRSMKIDSGNVFDWGRTASLYAACRDIYPSSFWERLHALGIGNDGQHILDIGTGTGILPMHMTRFGGHYTGVDCSPEMIKEAKALVPSADFLCADAHALPFADASFDAVTALQCWVYFDKAQLIPELARVLKPNGHLYVMFMTWLPEEDEIVRDSFTLVKRYNPSWSGYMKRTASFDSPYMKGVFSVESIDKWDVNVPFTREAWCARMVASRGIGATLNEEEISHFREDMMHLLETRTDPAFTVLHEAVIIRLTSVKSFAPAKEHFRR